MTNATPPPMDSGTQSFLLKLAGIVVAALVILVAYALLKGRISVPADVQSQLWLGVIGMLVAGTAAFNAYISTRNAARTQSKVDGLADKVVDGLKGEYGKAAADLVKVDNEERAAALIVTTTAAEEAKRAADAAQQTRDDLTTMREMIATLMAQRAAVSVASAEPPAIVAPNGDAIHTEIKENTAALTTSTAAIDRNTDDRLTLLEQAAADPPLNEGPP